MLLSPAAGRGWVRGLRRIVEHALNGCPNAFRILHNLTRPEAQDAPTFLLHYGGATRIRLDLMGMVFTVNFNDEPLRNAGRIGDVATNRMLATELDAAQSTITQQFPDAFRTAAVTPEVPGSLEPLRAHTPSPNLSP
jgi:hypothetical protein